jgi:hypothetical protein
LFFPISSHLFRSLLFSLSFSCVWHHLTHPLPAYHSCSLYTLISSNRSHYSTPTTPQLPSNPSPSCFNLILSPAQLAQGSIITRFDQNTIYLQQLRLSKCTQGFRDETQCLGASSNPYQSAFIFTPFDSALQNYNARSSPFVLIGLRPVPRLHCSSTPPHLKQQALTFGVFTFLQPITENRNL